MGAHVLENGVILTFMKVITPSDGVEPSHAVEPVNVVAPIGGCVSELPAAAGRRMAANAYIAAINTSQAGEQAMIF